MSDKKRINGSVYSWGSIILKIDSEEFSGIEEIKYSDKRERAYQWGTGRHQAPRGRSRGKYTPAGSMKVVRGTLADLIEKLKRASTDGISIGDVVVQITIQYVEFDETPYTVQLGDVVLVGLDATDTEGNEGLTDEIELMPMFVIRNGATLYDSRPA
jgi:hypothetical protein